MGVLVEFANEIMGMGSLASLGKRETMTGYVFAILCYPLGHLLLPVWTMIRKKWSWENVRLFEMSCVMFFSLRGVANVAEV